MLLCEYKLKRKSTHFRLPSRLKKVTAKYPVPRYLNITADLQFIDWPMSRKKAWVLLCIYNLYNQENISKSVYIWWYGALLVARLFLFGAIFFTWRDFFIWRVFYAGAWVTLCIPYYSVMNIVRNNPINCCIPLYTLKRG